MTFEELKALDHQYTMQTYGRFDVALDHGKGATLYGLEGEVYTDFASGIGVASLGRRVLRQRRRRGQRGHHQAG